METDKTVIKAKNNAYILLRSRPRSECEIRDRLKLKGYGLDIIETAVRSLEKAGDIDDGRFARFWIESRMQTNPVGDVVLKHELRAKGVADAIIDSALGDKGQVYDEYAVALDIARERFERLKRLDRPKASKRLYDFLARRGFRFDVIERIIREVAKGETTE